MKSRNLILVAIVAAGGWFGLKGVLRLFKSDEELVRECVTSFLDSLASGNRGRALSLTTNDFVIRYRNHVYSRREFAEHLAWRFFRGERIVVSGKIARLSVEEEDGKATLVWKGEAYLKSVKDSRRVGNVHRGRGIFDLRKEGGSWVIEQITTEREE